LKLSGSPPLHIAIALHGTSSDGADPSWWEELVRAADRAPFAFVTIADRDRDASAGGESERPAPLDALLLACHLAPRTRHVGLVPSVDTTLTEPFLVSSQLATLDFVSGGRAGWEVDVSLDPRAGGYVGPREVPPVAQRVEEAMEHVEVVRRLWDSWEDDAEIRDAASHRFLDRERVHPIAFAGRHLAVGGPSITPRSPQGQPLVMVRADGGSFDALAATSADIVFVTGSGPAELPDRLAALDELVAAAPDRDLWPLRFADIDLRTADRDRIVGLARWLAELAGAGWDGVRLHLDSVPDRVRELAAALPAGPAPAATLRERIGLARPVNRYATARP
jgi:alkanesulfonate monooxygenase SsuD/methylene tetrahydromethanopterin reductase-like flavin-dependent oxidoreductase (luciferase family)